MATALNPEPASTLGWDQRVTSSLVLLNWDEIFRQKKTEEMRKLSHLSQCGRWGGASGLYKRAGLGRADGSFRGQATGRGGAGVGGERGGAGWRFFRMWAVCFGDVAWWMDGGRRGDRETKRLHPSTPPSFLLLFTFFLVFLSLSVLSVSVRKWTLNGSMTKGGGGAGVTVGSICPISQGAKRNLFLHTLCRKHTSTTRTRKRHGWSKISKC